MERLSMTFDGHYNEVVAPTWNFAKRITGIEGDWANVGLGIAGEAGEIADAIKKLLFHTAIGANVQKLAEFELHLKKEMGDVQYYWNKLRVMKNWSVDEILLLNQEKLQSRHPELGHVAERYPKGFIK